MQKSTEVHLQVREKTLRGVKAEDHTTGESTGEERTEGEKFNEKMPSGVDVDGEQTNGASK